VVGADVGVELAVGLGLVVARVRVVVGLGDADRVGVERSCVKLDTGAVLARWCGFTCLTCCVGGGGAAGAPATPMPTRPVTVPAATLVVASTSVVRRCRPP
jgi:hypothetical protein